MSRLSWKRSLLAALGFVSTTLVVSADPIKNHGDPRGPCFVRGPDRPIKYHVTASGTCRCTDGSCRQISCEADVTGSIELTKQRLRAELQFKAQQLGGRLEAGVSFSVTWSR